MKKIALIHLLAISILTSAVPAMAARYADQPVTVQLQQDFRLQDQDSLTDYYTEYVSIGGNKKCSFWATSTVPTVLSRGTVISGTLTAFEKDVWHDSDEIGRRGTTQFTFTSNDESVRISAACFSDGILLPTWGLPSLRQLFSYTDSLVVFKRN